MLQITHYVRWMFLTLIKTSMHSTHRLVYKVYFIFSKWVYNLLQMSTSSDTESAFLNLNLSIHYDAVSTKIYDKRDDFDF